MTLHQWGIYGGLLAWTGIALSLVSFLLLRRYPRTVRNFRWEVIPVGYGLYLWSWAVAGSLAFWAASQWTSRPAAAALLFVAVIGLLGVLDDYFGVHGKGGFRGHFTRLVREKKLTTGAAKAIFGGAAALASALVLRDSPYLVLPDALLIALMANLINLMDLRPGRAGWVFILLLSLLTLAVYSHPQFVTYLAIAAPCLLALLVLLPRDSRAGWIMGDSGSNVLGGVLGVCLVAFLGVPARLALLALLVVLHIYAEKRSLSQLISSNPVLCYLDKKTGIRA